MKERAVIVFLTGRGKTERAGERIRNSVGKRDILQIGKVAVLRNSAAIDAYRISRLPGVMWTAYGFISREESILKDAVDLASNFIKNKRSFSVVVTEEKPELTDVKMSIEGNILSKFQKKKINEKKPDLTFILSRTEKGYAFGLKLYQGVGGSIQGEETVTCLVSGGMHSSVVAWLSCLSGKGVKIVHSLSSTYSLYSVARLYERLSSMSDPTLLELSVLKGEGREEDVLYSWLEDNGAVFSGNHIECSSKLFSSKVIAPAYVLPEEVFAKYQREMRLPNFERRIGEGGRYVKYKEFSFGGRSANMHEVIDSLRSN